MSIVKSRNIVRESKMQKVISELLCQELTAPNRNRILSTITEEFDCHSVRAVAIPKGNTLEPHILLLLIVRVDKDAIVLSELKRQITSSQILPRGTLLLAITPDETRPKQLDRIQNYPIEWVSFSKLIQGSTELVQNPSCVTSRSEISAMLKLQKLILDENLADRSEMTCSKDVAIIASPRELIYLFNNSDGDLLICRPNESFQKAERLGLYSRGEILNCLPKILETFENVDFRRDVNVGVLGQIVKSALPYNQQWEGRRCRIMRVSSRNSKDTLKLPNSIRNDLRSKSGQQLAYTMGLRLESIEALKTAKTTSDLA